MLGVYATLSLRYLRRRWFRAVLIVVSIAAGVVVGTLASISGGVTADQPVGAPRRADGMIPAGGR